jgi:hypothetical protein
MAARYRSILAGLILGCVSLFLTFHLNSLFAIDSNIGMRALKAAGFSLVVPGLIVAVVAGRADPFHPLLMAAVNFLFWFGFGWIFATFIAKLIQLRRAMAADGHPGDRPSSLRSK